MCAKLGSTGRSRRMGTRSVVRLADIRSRVLREVSPAVAEDQ